MTDSKVSKTPESPPFEVLVAQNLNLAFQNAISCQQSLNEIGIAVLAKSANFVQTAVGHALNLPTESRRGIPEKSPKTNIKAAN